MKKQRKSVIRWIKEHKKELIIAGVSIATIIAVVLAIKHRGELKKQFEALKAAVSALSNKRIKVVETEAEVCKAAERTAKTLKVVEPPAKAFKTVERPLDVLKVAETSAYPTSAKRTYSPCMVELHTRKLPAGHHASAKKLAEAEELGIILETGYTIVDSYSKGAAAA